ncbi:non-ribosomal peptide synthetase [Nocardia rosealba]|uniref:non-ribosomal peptide synthetase n=1 Tax=Nocardia rosealba TaxID=2878563 RepID=UPI001CD93E55|nr:non-ribosomal peptide synthetase [Nocardia rosealba]MCA2208204.1 non-ribosomal peptide synthase/polyketide synthase [Nocardia rosealba]
MTNPTPACAQIDQLAALVATVAAMEPARTAVGFDGTSVSYAELDAQLTLMAELTGGALDPETLVQVVLAELFPGVVDAAEGTFGRLLNTLAADAMTVLGIEAPAAGATLVDRFAEQLARTPDRVAVQFGDQTLTYAEFDARVRVLADRLAGLGVGPESLVGLAMRRSVELIVAVHAIVRAGGAYVPLDPDHPVDRLHYVLEVARPVVVVTRACDEPDLGGAAVLRTDDVDWSAVPAEIMVGAQAGNTAYVIFTSGSTGRPKGVAVTHSAIVANLDWRQRSYAMTEDDVVLQKTPYTFDVSVWELFWPLQIGARLVIAEPGRHGDPAYLADLIARHRVTVTHFVPSMLAAFVGELAEAATVGDLSSLRMVFASGEALPAATAARLRKLSATALHNLYGPTEAAVDVTAHEVTEADEVSVPIGGPADDTGLLVLDENLDQVPAGVVGELYLSGVQLARGYVARPGLTADRFVANPYGEPGERMYRTGDLVRQLPGGAELEYLGRTDFQVKLRGLRIELGEIEAVLAAHPRVGNAAVVLHRHAAGEALVGYVVSVDGEPVDEAELVAHAKASMPEYMVPSLLVQLPAMPINASGKLDRKALPEPDFRVAAAEFRAPVTATEQAVAALFAELLDVETVGLDDDFFRLGGNSLIATRAIARLHANFGVRVDVRDFFDSPTVAVLASLIDACDTDERPALVAGPRPSVLPLSPAQQRMWFLNRFDPTTGAYNIPIAVRLSGVLDHAALRAAVRDLIARHEVLRTVYPEVDGVGTQVVLDPAEAYELLVAEAAGCAHAGASAPGGGSHGVVEPALGAAAAGCGAVGGEGVGAALLDPIVVAAEELREVVAGEILRGFDVAVAPPVRVRLFEVDGDHVLVLVVHHIAADGWSAGPLVRDTMAAYQARTGGAAPAWEPLAVQYADYTLWQRAVLGEEDDPASQAGREIAFWRAALAGLPDESGLPTDRPRPAIASMRGQRVEFGLDAELVTALNAVAAERGATLFMVLHAALSVLIARLSGNVDVAIGSPVAGRGAAELDDVIGMFVNTAVLRTQVRAGEPFAELLGRVRADDLAAFEHTTLPFERLVEVLAPARSAGRHPLFQVALSLQNLPVTTFELPGLRASAVDLPYDIEKFDLSVTLRDAAADGLSGEFSYATDLFDVSTVTTMVRRFTGLLSAIAAAPHTPVADLPLLIDTELTELTTRGGVAEPAPLLPEVLARAAADPAAIAIRDGGQTLTYGELEAAATSLAARLADHGVGPGDVVAVSIPRSAASVTAVWAVIKSGAGFLPVDPNYPADRITHMLADSGAAAGITTDEVRADLPAAVDWLVVDLDAVHTDTHADVVAPRLAEGDGGRIGLGHGPSYRPLSGAKPDVGEGDSSAGDRVDVAAATVVPDVVGNGDTTDPHSAEAGKSAGGFGAADIAIDGFGASGDARRPHPLDPAYVIYTSGTTGLPKGVVIPHAAVAAYLPVQAGRYRAAADARVLHVASPSFDISVAELLLTVSAGATMVVAPNGVFGGAELGELLRVERVTHVVITPSALATVDPVGLVDLRVVVVGGEACPAELVARWTAAIPGLVFRNGYGPTETTIVTNISEPLGATTPITLGGPVEGTTELVLDERLRPVPAGVVGELYIAGAQLARGYHRRPALTASRFVTNPYGAPGERMYRTGDTVRWVRRGDSYDLEYLGRNDFQVKVRGFRIELGEIDAVLAKLPTVRFAVTIGHRTEAGATLLVSYVVQAPEAAVDTSELLAHSAAHLPAHMVPATIMTLDEVPLTPVGKLDRSALPAPVFEAAVYRAPVTRAEQVVADAFAEVLGLEQVGRDDDFFELGGNSLLATRVMARIGTDLDIRIPVRQLFDTASVRSLADAADRLRGTGAGPALVAGVRPDPLPLSPAQQRMWFLNRFDPGSSADNIPMAVRLTGDLDVPALRAALADVLDRHEVLRTRYPERDGHAIAEILPTPGLLPDIHPEVLSTDDLPDAIRTFATAGFDLTTDAPLRIALFRVRDTREAPTTGYGPIDTSARSGEEPLLADPVSTGAALQVTGVSTGVPTMLDGDAPTDDGVRSGAAQGGTVEFTAEALLTAQEQFGGDASAGVGQIPGEAREAAVSVDGAAEYVLAIVLHHIAADGFSFGPLIRDVLAAYGARAVGEAPAWEPLSVQYADYAVWQHAVLGTAADPGSVAAQQLSYWRRTLDGLPEQLELPADRPRPAVASRRGALHAVEFEAETHRALAEFARAHGVTVFMAVHAVFAVLLARLSATTDIAIGTPVSGRGHRALDDLVGMFVNTLVLRTEVAPATPFAELVARVRDTDLAAFGHADVPFERLVEALDPVRSTARNPLFQVMLSLNEDTARELVLPGLTVGGVDLPTTVAKFDLELTLTEHRDENGAPTGLSGAFLYATDLFDAATVAGFATRLHRALTSALTDPTRPVGDIDLLDDTERTQLLAIGDAPSAAGSALTTQSTDRAVVDAAAQEDFAAAASGLAAQSGDHVAAARATRAPAATATLASLFADQVAASPGATALILDAEPAGVARGADLADTAVALDAQQPVVGSRSVDRAATPIVSDAEPSRVGGVGTSVFHHAERGGAGRGSGADSAVAIGGPVSVRFTYAEFGERVARLARHLIGLGAGPGSLVAVAMRRGVEQLVAVHAVLAAGAAYVPVDPDHPADRTAYVLARTAPVCVLTVAGSGVGVGEAVEVDTLDLSALSGDPIVDEERCAPLRPDNLAYVLFTSGSTGRPKGVAVPHRAVVNQLRWLQSAYPLSADDVVLQKTPFTFDASVWELLWPLQVGARLVLAAPDGHRDPAYLAAATARHSVSVVQYVPSVLTAVMAETTGTVGDPHDRSGDVSRGQSALRLVFAGGEALTTELARAVRERTGATVVNLYGPTETAIQVTTHRFADDQGATVPIGSPVAETRVYVLDSRLHPVPAGVPGELYVAGAQLADGYHGRADLTAERFVANPFGTGDRLYRTGDLVTWRTTSTGPALHYLGRTDFQVKLRGLRIEPAEIEAALTTVSGVRRAVVVVRSDDGKPDQLVAYIVRDSTEPEPVADARSAAPSVGVIGAQSASTAAGSVPTGGAQSASTEVGVDGTVSGAPDRDACTPADLDAAVTATLPAYMVPGAYVFLDELPLTASGKLDRRALPAPQVRRTVHREPATTTERIVAATFAGVLELDRVGADDDFFALGGNSLLATQVAARLGAALDARVAVRELFEASTVSGLAQRLDTLRGTGSRRGPVAGQRPQRIPLSPAQQRMWFLHRFDPESAAYHIPVAIRLSGELDVPALRGALGDLVFRHETLRTTYPEFDGQATQLVGDPFVPELTVSDVSATDVSGAVAQVLSGGFDITAEVPVRVALLRVTPTEHVLVLVVHHIAADGWSMGPLTRDLVAAYAARATGSAPQLPPLTVHYADYALWQTEGLGSVDDPDAPLARQLDYWRHRLAALPDVLTLPTDRRRPLIASVRGATFITAFDAHLHRGIEELARARRASTFMVLHAGLAVLLARLSSGSDIVVGTPVAGRGHRELDDIVGMFVNTLVLRAEVRGETGFADLLDQIRAGDLDAFDNADVPFETLVDAVNPARSQGYSPLYQVSLALQNQRRAAFELPGLTLSGLELPDAPIEVDLDFTFVDRFDADGEPDGLDLELRYATDLFDAETVAAMAAMLELVLRAAVQAPATPVGDLELLAEPARAELVAGPHGEVVPLERELAELGIGAPLAAHLLDAAAARDPQAIAAVFEGTEITYGVLAARANRLARRLIECGVGPETPVAVAVPRGIDLLVVLHGVLAAGGVYVPIDPAQPADRIGHVLATAAPRLVVAAEASDLDHVDADIRSATASVHFAAASRSGFPVLTVAQLEDPAQVPVPGTPVTDAERLAPLLPDHPAYALFTSGSTGLPKGVLITHRAVVNELCWLRGEYALTAEDRLLQRAPLTFDVSLWELLAPALLGATLVLLRPGGHLDLAYQARVLREQRVTVVELVPSVLSAMLAEGLGDALRGLRMLHVGGEELPAPLAATVLATLPVELHNTYGPTEVAITSTFQQITAPVEQTELPIGRPTWNVRAYVLDERLHPVPTGVTGELYLAGAQLARGYLGRPDLTADRFVADPFGTNGTRMYRTGDLVRRDRNGALIYLGRNDFQVKIRGLRIELGEIEAALGDVPGVTHATVLPATDDSGRQCLVGYVAGAVDAAKVRDHVASRVPAYMVPTHFVVLDTVPLNSAGKLDRAALPAADLSVTTAYVAPRPGTQATLAEVIADLLGVARIGADDDFFAVGGNSLLAMRLVARANAALGSALDVRDVFEAPTVAGLAERATDGEQLPPLAAVHPRPDRIPLSLAQTRLWLLNRIDPDSAVYTLPIALRLTGDLDIAALWAALADVLARHEALRTVFPEDADGPTQVVLPVDQALPDAVLEEVPEPNLAAAVRAVVGAGFDLTTKPPLRAALLRPVPTPANELPDHGHLAGKSADYGVVSLGDVLPHGVDHHEVGRRAGAHNGDGSGRNGGDRVATGGVNGPARALGDASADRVSGDGARTQGVTSAGGSTRDHEYVFVLAVHHIAADGVSITPLARDLIAAYAARTAGFAPQWEPLPVQYPDFTLWQREVLGDADDPKSRLARQLAHWRDELAGLAPALELAADRPRPAVRAGEGAAVGFDVPTEVVAGIEALARRHGTSTFMVVHAAFAVLLARHGAGGDIAIGTPVAGRADAALDDLVGMFVNTLVLRTPVDAGAAFADLLATVRAADLRAFAHADLPFERLVDELNPVRSTSYAPIVQVMLAFEHRDDTTVELPGLRIDEFALPAATTQFDLSLAVNETAGAGGRPGMRGWLRYATDLFDAETVAAFGARFVRVLRAVIADDTAIVGEIDLLDDTDRAKLAVWNSTHAPLDTDATLVSMFAEQALRTPDAIALEFEGQRITYGEFAVRVARLARWLIGERVGPGAIVGVGLRRGIDLLVALYAVQAAGAAYLPLDPDHPADRIADVLATAAPVCVLAASGFPETGTRTIDPGELDLDDFDAHPVTDADRLRPLRGADLAYVLFTSGSTGKPKGVAVSHTAIVNRLVWMQNTYGLTPAETVLQKTPITFDVSVWELFWPLQIGATLVIARPDGHRDPAYLAEVITRTGVGVAHFVPSMLAAFLAEPRSVDCVSLRSVFASGEALPAADAQRLRALIPGVAVHNLYGPTEAAVDVTFHEVTDADTVTVPIGAPVANTALHVLDARLRPVPVGTPGELYLAGVQLASGYLGRPDLSADRFVANPYGAPGERMYRTGDLVVRTRTGELEYLGRTDFQVKLRGLRIELGEIEAVLGGIDTVDRAVVTVRDDGTGPYLTAYLVPTRGQIDLAQVKARLQEALPAYMVPTAFVVLDALPVNASGKLDRRALPAPELSAREFRAPATVTEILVAGIIGDVLGAERVGADDGFFDLGGNSLIATRVAARLGAALDRQVPVARIFEAPVVAALATALDTEAGPARLALTAGERPAVVPLSPAQQRMWFLNRFDPDSVGYNVPIAVRLRGVLDTDALAAAVDDLVDRHEVLRTYYPETADGPVQRILSAAEAGVALEIRDITPDEVAGAVTTLAATTFDVTAGVPWRVVLYRLDADDAVLALVVHHISADGSSVPPLVRDLMTAYLARRDGTAPAWAPLPVQYADYALWQRAVLGDETDPTSVAARQLDFWRTELAGVPDELALPLDRPRPAARTMAGGTVPVTLDAATHARLTELARECGATLFMVVHTAFAALLGRLSNSTDVTVGTPVAGRGEAALEDLVGMFVNTLVFRTRLRAGESFRQLLIRQRATDLAVFANADVPFERLVEVLDPARSTARHPLFQVGFSFQNFERAELELPGITVSGLDTDGELSQFDLHLIVSDDYTNDGAAAGVSGVLTYATDVFDPETAAAVVTRLERLLTAVAAEPQTPVDAIDVLDAEERTRILDHWNDTSHEIDRTVTLLAPYRYQVATRPDATALIFEGEHLTYGELDTRVNRLARHLITDGVGPDTLVALAMRRSVDLVVAMYAVLTAGGAYVPIDPDHPTDRITQILTTARPHTVLTTSRDRFEIGAVTSGEPPTADDPVDSSVAGHTVPSVGVRVVLVDRLDLQGYSTYPVGDTERLAPLRDSNLAYVLFTSGSTGRPKGVAMSHAGVRNQVVWMIEQYRLGAGDVYLQKSAATFDLSVWGYFVPLAAGATLVLAAPDGHRDPLYLAELVARQRITVVDFVPSMLSMFAAHAEAEQLSSLRLVLAIGEALTPDTVTAFRAKSAAALHNLYGPTEAAVSVTAWPAGDATGPTVPIGVPEWNTQVYVLDDRLRPVAPGVAGELYLAGDQLARGYLGRPDLTADRFVADPFTAPGERMYRTGDLVRWTRDGVLVYLDRRDFQVKFRGQRIELGDIEAALRALPGVRQAAAVVSPSPTGDRLVGYAVPQPGAELDPAFLRTAVGGALPSYMVPSVVVVLDAFPLNTSGKLDRAALPAPEFVARPFRAPVTPVQRVVAQVFAEVLGREQVGLDDDFFELGGNSLIATRVAARLGAALSTRVPVRTLFEATTVAALAELLAGHAGSGAGTALVAGPRPQRIPLSAAQQRMWLLNRLDPESAAYNIPIAVRLTGDVDADALAAAVTDVLERHEVLRTAYPAVDGIGHQAVWEFVPAPVVESVDPIAVPSIVAAEIGRGFDVTVAPPVRVRVLRCAADEVVLVVVIHHISADGFSAGPLLRDTTAAYLARRVGTAPDWAPLAIQYADYTLWQRSVLGDEQDPESLAARQVRFWRTELDGLASLLELPTDRPRPAVASQRGASVETAVPQEVWQRVTAVARRADASEFMVAHAALAVLLARLSGAADIAVGTPVAGRGAAALDDLVGMFVNTLVLRTGVDPAASFTSLLKDARRVDLDAFDNADVPFERLVDVLDPVRSAGHSPLFQVMLAFQNLGATPTEVVLPDLTVTAIDADAAVAKFDLDFVLADTAGGGCSVRLTYATDLFDATTAHRMAEAYVRILDAVTADPDIAVGDVDLLTDADHRMLESWCDTDHPLAPETLVDGFYRQVAATPSAIAFVDDTTTLTYGDFADRVNRLARYLITLGVGPDTAVAVAARRSTDLLVGLYAVIVAGGTYVPVDPDHPAERIARVLDIARPACLLTTSRVRADLPISMGRGIDVVVLDEIETAALSGQPVDDAERTHSLRPEHTAYVIFTSGSTGLPKGVGVPHRAIVNQLDWMAQEFGFTAGDTVLHKTPTTFDASIWELFLGPRVGARTVIARPGGHGDPAYLAAVITEHRIDTVQFAPTLLAAYLAHIGRTDAVTPAAATRRPYRDDSPDTGSQTSAVATSRSQADSSAETVGAMVAFAAGRSPDDRGPGVDSTRSLRRIFAGGEALPAALAEQVRTVTGAEVVNLYGPTETAVQVSTHVVTDDDTVTVPIGTPVWNTGLYVLDARLRPVPPGVVGELYVGGAQLAHGYVGAGALTAERFVPDPFGAAGTRMYRTGDLVRLRGERTALEYVGRSDLQVKLNGQRIELGEVEAVLARQPGVAQAAAAVVPGTGADRLVGYVVPARGRSSVGSPEEATTPGTVVAHSISVIDTAALRSALADELPGYLVPSVVVELDEFPVNTSGKLDRGALPAPRLRQATYRAPVTETEQRVAAEFARVLDLDRIGMDDNFFDLGGNSLTAVQLASRLSETLGTPVPVAWFFTDPTPAVVVERLRGDDAQADAFAVLLPLRTGGTGAPLFCIHPVGGLSWSFAGLTRHLDPQRPVYGLQSPALTADEPVPDSIDAWARRYIDAIRSVQPEGPYHLLGWSLGGLLAHAVATGLRAEGEQVARLAMMDSWLGDGPEQTPAPTVGDLLGGLAGEDLDFGIDGLTAAAANLGGPLAGLDRARIARITDAAQASMSMVDDYRPRRFDGDLVYFAATVDDPTGTHGAATWAPVVDGAVICHRIEATHWAMTNEHALARIAQVLDATGRGEPAPRPRATTRVDARAGAGGA